MQDYEKDQLYLPLLLKKWYKPSTSGRTIFKNGSVADVVVIDESNTRYVVILHRNVAKEGLGLEEINKTSKKGGGGYSTTQNIKI